MRYDIKLVVVFLFLFCCVILFYTAGICFSYAKDINIQPNKNDPEANLPARQTDKKLKQRARNLNNEIARQKKESTKQCSNKIDSLSAAKNNEPLRPLMITLISEVKKSTEAKGQAAADAIIFETDAPPESSTTQKRPPQKKSMLDDELSLVERGNIMLHYVKAKRLFLEGKYDKARKQTDEILKIDAANNEALRLLEEINRSCE